MVQGLPEPALLEEFDAEVMPGEGPAPQPDLRMDFLEPFVTQLAEEVESLKEQLDAVSQELAALQRSEQTREDSAGQTERSDEDEHFDPEVIYGGDTDPSKESFGHSLSGTTCTIYTGTLRMPRGLYPVSQTNVTLSGATEWVYVELDRSLSAGTDVAEIKHSSTEPESTTTHLRVPLYEFTGVAGVYTLTRDRRPDIVVDFPL